MNIFKEFTRPSNRKAEEIASIANYFDNAGKIWQDIEKKVQRHWDDPDITKILANEITKEIQQFRLGCGHEPLSDEIMIITGFDKYYDPRFGFQDRLRKAQTLKTAILVSGVDTKTKAITEKIANLYNL